MSGSETELDELDDWYQMGCWTADFVPPCFDDTSRKEGVNMEVKRWFSHQ